MAASAIVDASFLVTLLSRRESNHRWAADQTLLYPPPWKTCEAALSEAFHLLGSRGAPSLAALLRRAAVVPAFHLEEGAQAVLRLMHKYADVPLGEWMKYLFLCVPLLESLLLRAGSIVPYPSRSSDYTRSGSQELKPHKIANLLVQHQSNYGLGAPCKRVQVQR